MANARRDRIRSQETHASILNASANQVDYEYILQRIGFGRGQWMLALISGLLTLSSMSSLTSTSIIVIASACEFQMGQIQKGMLMAASVAGVFVSTYFWGYVSDAYGRRTVLLYCMLSTSVLQFVSMFVTNVWFYNVLNLAFGISLGGISAAIYAYISEYTAPKYRDIVINYTSMFVSVAAIYVPATSWLVLSYDWSLPVTDTFALRPWRLIILLNLLPGLVAVIMLLPYRESPKLLLVQGKIGDATEALEWLCQLNTGRTIGQVIDNRYYNLKPEVDVEDDLMMTTRSTVGIFVSMWKATVPLFHKPHRASFFLCALTMFGMFFSYSGIQIWYPEIVNRSSNGSSTGPKTVCHILDSSFAQEAPNATAITEVVACDESISRTTYVDNIIIGCAFLAGFLIQGTLLNAMGRKNVLLAALAISTFSGILLHFVTNAHVILVLFCLYILMPGLAISIMCGAVVGLVPTQLRGKAVSICLTIGRLGVILATNIIGIMLEPLCNTTFAIFTTTMLVCGFLVYILPI